MDGELLREVAKARKAVNKLCAIIRERLQSGDTEVSHKKIDPLVAVLQNSLNNINLEIPDFSRPTIIAADYLLNGYVKHEIPKQKEKMSAHQFKEYEKELVGRLNYDEKQWLELLDNAERQIDRNSALSGENLRLTVSIEKITVTLDGDEYDLKSELQARWLKVLAEHPGHWISGTRLVEFDSELDGTRTDRVRKRLPEEISSLIEISKRKGARIRLA